MSNPQIDAYAEAETPAIPIVATPARLALEISPKEISEMTMLALKSPDPAGAVKQLIEMRHLEQDRQAEREFNDALNKFHAECPTITKSKTAKITTKGGTSYTYQYVPLDVLDKTLRPIARRNGLRWKWDGVEASGKMTKTCTLRHIGGHSESSSFTCTVDSKADISGPQKAGGASSYAKRQTLLDVFGLAAYEQDNDGAPGTMATITPDQVTHIEDLIMEADAKLAPFLDWASIARVEEMPAVMYKPAVQLLERRRDKKK